MIENIYSNENKRSKDWNKTNVMFRMPKNIRQIGQADTSKKIYIEDYVMTYIRQLAMKDFNNYKVAVLLGQFIKIDGTKNIFIKGAVEATDVNIETQSAFTNETWTNIYEDVKKYFDDVEIVGWYVSKPGLALETTEQLVKVHVDNFAGQDKTLFMYDCIEKEEAFYVYDNNKLSPQKGYYIYYEKNEEMQNYMVENKNVPSLDEGYDDRAIKEIRQIIEGKKENNSYHEQGSVVRLLYGASTLLAVVVLVIGATMLTNYDQMKSIENTLGVISKHVVGPQEVSNAPIEDTETIVDKVTEVETMSGNIEKIKEGQDTIPEQSAENALTQEGTSQDSTTKKSTIEQEVLKENLAAGDAVKTTDDAAKKDTAVKTTEDAVKTDATVKTTKDTVETDATAKTTEDAVKKDAAVKTTEDTVKTDAIAKTTETSTNKVQYYTIKTGDSLLTISMKFYNSVKYVDEILEANKIKDQDKILVGQKIIIP